MSRFRRSKEPGEYAVLAADPATLFAAGKASMNGRLEHLHSPMRSASKAVSCHQELPRFCRWV
jgi:hypothetical protein